MTISYQTTKHNDDQEIITGFCQSSFMVKGESLLKTLSKENLQPLKHRPLYSIQKKCDGC